MLVLEIVAGRLLAPYVGVSLETYTGIIGTVLAGISLGTWLGGRLADRVDPRSILGPAVLVGGVFALLSVPAVRLLGPLATRAGPVEIVLLAVVGFFLPAAVLSAVAPVVVKLQLADLGETGRVVGRLSGIGTAGAIAGTFLAGFLLVAALPTQEIILGVGGSLVVLGVALAWRTRAHHGTPVAAVVALGVAASAGSLALPGPCQLESAYFCARVEVDPARPSGRLLVLDTLWHSYVDLDDPTHLEFEYTRTLGAVVDALTARGDRIAALHVGGGGFSMPRYVAATRPGSPNLVLELDPMILRIGREQLGLVTGPLLEVRIGDARLGIRGVPSGSQDVVIGDAFGGLAVPWHLTTREFVSEVRRTLRPGGVYALNVIDDPPLAFARGEVATLASVFRHVAVFGSRAKLEGRDGGNFILVASDEPLPVDAIAEGARARAAGDRWLADDQLPAFVGDASVLTDDHAPVDQLLAVRRR